ncbi:MAG: hypothetical protein ACJ735_16740 [Actinomycetes bacterium]
MGLGERLRKLDEWATGRRFIACFVGGNVVLASILVTLSWRHPPKWLAAALVLVYVIICLVGGTAMFAWLLRRAWIGWRDRY